MNLLISFAYLCLNIAVIIFVAYCLVWLLRWLGVTIDGNVYKFGQIIVGLLIIIAVLIWLSGLLGGFATFSPMFWSR